MTQYEEALELLDEARGLLAHAGCCAQDALDARPDAEAMSEEIDKFLVRVGYDPTPQVKAEESL